MKYICPKNLYKFSTVKKHILRLSENIHFQVKLSFPGTRSLKQAHHLFWIAPSFYEKEQSVCPNYCEHQRDFF